MFLWWPTTALQNKTYVTVNGSHSAGQAEEKVKGRGKETAELETGHPPNDRGHFHLRLHYGASGIHTEKALQSYTNYKSSRFEANCACSFFHSFTAKVISPEEVTIQPKLKRFVNTKQPTLNHYHKIAGSHLWLNTVMPNVSDDYDGAASMSAVAGWPTPLRFRSLCCNFECTKTRDYMSNVMNTSSYHLEESRSRFSKPDHA